MAEASPFVGTDNSLYNRLQGPVAPANPMQQMGQMVGMQNGMLQNKLLQAQVPLQINNEQVANAQKHLQYVSDQLTPLLSLGPKVTPDDVTRVAMQAVANSGGAISGDEGGKFVQQIITNPQGIQAGLQQFHMRTMQGLTQLQALSGAPGQVDTGPSIQHTNRNLYTGGVSPAGGSAGSVDVYPSRATMAAPAPVGTNPATGAPIMGTTQQQINNRGGQGLLAPAFRQAPTTAPAAPGQPGPTEAPMEAPMKALQGDLQGSATKMSSLQPLLQAIPLIDKLGPSGAGPSSQVENDLKSFLVTRGLLKADDTNVDVRNEANKYLKQFVQENGGGAAGGSDYRTAFSSDANPNLNTDQKATLALAKSVAARQRMEAARPLAFGNDPQAKINDYGKHQATWTQSQDIRAYGLDLMDPKKGAALVQQMSKDVDSKDAATRQSALKFFQSLQNAHKNGMLTGTVNAGQ